MKFIFRSSILLLSSLFWIISCKEDPALNKGTGLSRLTTQVAASVLSTSAWSGGNISNDGGSPILARGVVWSMMRNPTVLLPTKTSDGKGTGSFTSRLTGLLPSTTYFVRAYATNQEGTEYGNEISFTTETNLPTLTTTIVSDIAASSVNSGGIITNDGELAIINRGVVWGTESNPTVSLSTKTSDGTGTGPYESTITGLTPGIKYYLRAYATNSAGTSYGNEIIFEAESPWDELDISIAQIMNRYDVPGLSVAVIRNEKLVYLKSFGFSDKEGNIKARNSDLYRIAGVSRLITYIATLNLIQNGKISMDERVFGTNSILRNDFGSPPTGSGKDLLTVRHLLEHKSGWINAPYDPMYGSNNLTQAQIINDVLINRPLTYLPGTTYNDLNFGYCTLGRIIEKLNYLPYENYARSVFYDFGVTNLKIGGNTESERAPNEVKYYQREVSPYSLNIKRMDAHDGWIASAKDLAKIMIRVDGNLNVPDIISLSINPFNSVEDWVQYGSLPGTSSILHRLDDKFSFIVLSNTRTESDPSILLKALDNTVIEQIKERPSWPSYDLF